MSILVAITSSELLQYAIWGVMRNIQSSKLAEDKYGANTAKDGWQINIMSVIAEAGWAKHRGAYYNASIRDYKAADVCGFYQIRSSSIVYKSNACLRIHDADADDLPYILALVDVRAVEFVGWLFASEAKHARFWRDKWNVGRPAFFVEQSDLRPMEEIPNPPEKLFAESC